LIGVCAAPKAVTSAGRLLFETDKLDRALAEIAFSPSRW
jgi:hypothetical protein